MDRNYRFVALIVYSLILLGFIKAFAKESSKGVRGSGITFYMGLKQFKTKELNSALSSVGINGYIPGMHFVAGTSYVGFLGRMSLSIESGSIISLTSTGSKVSSQGFYWGLGGGYFVLIKREFGVSVEVRWHFSNVNMLINNPPTNVPNSFTQSLLLTPNVSEFNVSSQSVVFLINLTHWKVEQLIWGIKLGFVATYGTVWRYSGLRLANSPTYEPFGLYTTFYLLL